MAKRSKSGADENGIQVVARNRKAGFDYDLGDRFEAGLALIGSEVKSLRHGTANISEAWANVSKGEVFVEGMKIPVLMHAAFGHKENRTRKLLLHRREIESLEDAISRKGMTVVITKLYFKEGFAKVELAVAKGLQKGDKREAIKGREAEREAKAAIARGRRGG